MNKSLLAWDAIATKPMASIGMPPRCLKEWRRSRRFKSLYVWETLMRSVTSILAALVTILGLAFPFGAEAAPPGVKIGELVCHVSSGFGFVFGSSRDLRCIFRPAAQTREHYLGSVEKFGVDLGYTEGDILIWTVI